MSHRLRDRWQVHARLLRSLGLRHAVRYKFLQWLRRLRPPDRPFQVSTRAAAFPLLCRPGTSDEEVFWQVFAAGEYACLDPPVEPHFILDCGANVGYTAAYLLTRFPGAFLLAVEPDPGNAEILSQNLLPYGDRARILKTAIWSHKVGLVLSTIPFRDGREWARQFREARPGETPQMFATDIGTVIEKSGYRRVGILKIDIEGAEQMIFSRDCSSWLPLVDSIAIELHSAHATAAFTNALRNAPFSLSQHGDITLATRRSTSIP
jgi:FkbM family methyltransferase